MKKKVLDYLIVYLGCFIQAFAVTCILKPNNLTVGGITGLSLTIGEIIYINYTYIYYFICLLVLFTAKIFLGNKEARKIILLSTTYPLILMFMNNFRFNFLSDTPDKLLICIYYGIFMGVGTGLVLKKGFSQGSSDTLSKVIQKKLFPFIGINQVMLCNINVKIENKITAEDVMDPTIKPVSPYDTLDDIARRLITEEKPGFPVVDDNGDFLGEMTERELISYEMPDYTSVMDDLNFFTVGEPFEEYLKNEKTATIDEIYRRKTTVVDRKTPIMEICLLMVNKGFTRIYVVEKGKYYGTILRSHIIKKVLHI